MSVMIRGANGEISSRGSAMALFHDIKDMQTALAGLLESFLQDHGVDAGDLDVHLQSSDALRRAR